MTTTGRTACRRVRLRGHERKQGREEGILGFCHGTQGAVAHRIDSDIAMIIVNCSNPKCPPYEASDLMAGLTVICPGCQARVLVPGKTKDSGATPAVNQNVPGDKAPVTVQTSPPNATAEQPPTAQSTAPASRGLKPSLPELLVGGAAFVTLIAVCVAMYYYFREKPATTWAKHLASIYEPRHPQKVIVARIEKNDKGVIESNIKAWREAIDKRPDARNDEGLAFFHLRYHPIWAGDVLEAKESEKRVARIPLLTKDVIQHWYSELEKIHRDGVSNVWTIGHLVDMESLFRTPKFNADQGNSQEMIRYRERRNSLFLSKSAEKGKKKSTFT